MRDARGKRPFLLCSRHRKTLKNCSPCTSRNARTARPASRSSRVSLTSATARFAAAAAHRVRCPCLARAGQRTGPGKPAAAAPLRPPLWLMTTCPPRPVIWCARWPMRRKMANGVRPPRDETTAIPLPADGDLDRISRILIWNCRILPPTLARPARLSVRSPYYVPTRCPSRWPPLRPSQPARRRREARCQAAGSHPG